ncbi:pyrroline-5-carboxylate reductase [Lachnoanaerobaculum saburreum F0468]|jgi:pyrroline-5-carboxylate reductase|uniref:Pyrroline-5-carboxylate reductase n=2 Tax=Lachnoanaerobaculum saburreum TaxID=467210 RepID=I0R9U7_9FIRM|nr:pyrroline-5-carboxylate reductase [Lachnoanaerobaculum saburreum]EFU76684.1 pyrroline-5-carboxylate reductase [Lachnoanaerobaculum saburreum DSM 3986]EIC96455.1 pyrroline-5-carboxylate reductase [Lachnoanaerobaculum saburreum F0468]RKW40130.1 MAG: pyrroline-5-carboxylate reductase [Lachnospiraceae bacterium]
MSKGIGFIGGGNMAAGIIEGLIKRRVFLPENIYVKEAITKREYELKRGFGISIVDSAEDLASKVNLIVFAVRPQDGEAAAKEILPYLDEKKIIVSLLAGISIDKLHKWFGEKTNIARVMPNTMIESQRGYSALVFDKEFPNDKKEKVTAIVEAIGKTMEMQENQLDAFTAIGCAGPEWLTLITASLVDAGVKIGLSRSDSKQIVIENLIATGMVLEKTKKHFYQIIDEINAPGGISIEGLHVLEKAGVQGSIMEAVEAAYKKTTEIGKQ